MNTTGLKFTSVESSMIDAYSYIEKDQILLVRFHNGSVYKYMKVGPSEVKQFEESSSKGKFLKSNFQSHGYEKL